MLKKKPVKPTVNSTPTITESFAIKYRPKNLETLFGQPLAQKIVQGWFKTKQIPPVILLTGPTSSGKTTISQIIANHLNDYDGDFESNPDVLYINAATERGIDDIRSLVKTSNFLPQAKFRIIILDEIHALPKVAASVLLVPLEKPDSHTIWILCTDQPWLLLPTIANRAQTIQLKPYTVEGIVQILELAINAENIQLGPKKAAILEHIAKATACQPRASLQLLQTLSTVLASGGKPSEALASAMETLQGHDTEQILLKTILATYVGKPNLVWKTLSETSDHIGLLNQAIELHRHVLDLKTNANKSYYSATRKQLEQELKARFNNELPDLSLSLQIHDCLLKLKHSAGVFVVKDLDLLATGLSMLAQKISEQSK